MPRITVYFYPCVTGSGIRRVPTFAAPARDGAILGTIEAPEGSGMADSAEPLKLLAVAGEDGTPRWLTAERAVACARAGEYGLAWEGGDGIAGD